MSEKSLIRRYAGPMFFSAVAHLVGLGITAYYCNPNLVDDLVDKVASYTPSNQVKRLEEDMEQLDKHMKEELAKLDRELEQGHNKFVVDLQQMHAKFESDMDEMFAGYSTRMRERQEKLQEEVDATMKRVDKFIRWHNLCSNDAIDDTFEQYFLDHYTPDRRNFTKMFQSYCATYLYRHRDVEPIENLLLANRGIDEMFYLKAEIDLDGTFKFTGITSNPEFRDLGNQVKKYYKTIFEKMPGHFMPPSVVGIRNPHTLTYVIHNPLLIGKNQE
jgi:hypothetical protein